MTSVKKINFKKFFRFEFAWWSRCSI